MKSIKIFIVFFCICNPIIKITAQDDVVIPDTTFNLEDIVDDEVDNEDESNLFIERSAEDPPQAIEIRKIPDSGLASLRSDESFWYANHDFANEKSEKSEFNWMGDWIWVLITIFFLGMIIWYLANSKIEFFRRRPRRIKNEKDEKEITSIFDVDFPARIRNAERDNDFRLAVRLHFLELLAIMARKNLIKYKQDFTNQEYLRQLRQTGYYPALFKLTRNYEYAWYGHFDLEHQAYKRIESEFSNFKQTIRG